MTPNEQITIIAALRDGNTIEWKRKSCQHEPWPWMTCNLDLVDPCFDFADCIYRVKPEPKTIWVNEYDAGISIAYRTRETAEREATPEVTRIAVQYREVVK